jgi:hypothetical protein
VNILHQTAEKYIKKNNAIQIHTFSYSLNILFCECRIMAKPKCRVGGGNYWTFEEFILSTSITSQKNAVIKPGGRGQKIAGNTPDSSPKFH